MAGSRRQRNAQTAIRELVSRNYRENNTFAKKSFHD
jgi:hypothetical protein